MVKTIRILLLCIGVLAAAGLCADDTGTRRGGGKPIRRSGQIVRPDAADIRYAPKRPELVADDPACDRLLDVYLPRTGRPATGYPCVMFIHGGGFRSGSKRSGGNLNVVCRKLLEHGIAVVSINYYLVRKYSRSKKRDMDREVRLAAEDAELAMKWIADHAGEYGFDLDRFAVCGGSAGARTCFELAYIRKPEAPKIRAVIDLWGIMVSPEKIRGGTPPALIIHGDKDRICDIAKACAIKNRLDRLRVPNRMIVLKGRGHSQYREVAGKYMTDVIAFLNQYWER